MDVALLKSLFPVGLVVSESAEFEAAISLYVRVDLSGVLGAFF